MERQQTRPSKLVLLISTMPYLLGTHHGKASEPVKTPTMQAVLLALTLCLQHLPSHSCLHVAVSTTFLTHQSNEVLPPHLRSSMKLCNLQHWSVSDHASLLTGGHVPPIRKYLFNKICTCTIVSTYHVHSKTHSQKEI